MEQGWNFRKFLERVNWGGIFGASTFLLSKFFKISQKFPKGEGEGTKSSEGEGASGRV